MTDNKSTQSSLGEQEQRSYAKRPSGRIAEIALNQTTTTTTTTIMTTTDTATTTTTNTNTHRVRAERFPLCESKQDHPRIDRILSYERYN
ncbi:hypothetical protein M0802_003505 [Mischocyttarus mexicanus]|nr:hypothetical protein M0802_003505 [Mischocyttarus mexicanus]